MTAIAHEVSRRMTPGYAKERAKEMARHRALEVRDRAVENPWLGPLLGAGIGALVGRALMTRMEERRREYGYDVRRFGEGGYRDRWGRGDGYGYGADVEVWGDEDVEARYEGSLRSGSSLEGEDTSRGMGAKASEKAAAIGDKATEMKDRLAGKAGEVRERVRERTDSLRSRIPDREAMRSNAQEQPAFWALGAAALGALFGFALPVSAKEREVLEPAKQKMRDATHQAMDKAVEKVEARGEQEQRADEPRATESSTLIGAGTIPPTPDPLH